MCLLALAIGQLPHCPLVLASNRDEYLDRPTVPLSLWQSPAGRRIASGRDGRAGGTWIGFAEGGRAALLTNVREDGSGVYPVSRGRLVMDWLDGDGSWHDWLAQQQADAMAGFNLLLGDWTRSEWWWLSNRPGQAQSGQACQAPAGWQVRRLPPGVYGLSNASLDTPWPKTLYLKQALSQTLARHADELSAPITPLARTDTVLDRLPATEWPQALLHALQHRFTDHSAAVWAEAEPREQALAHPFVEYPSSGYGTRSSLLVRGLMQGHEHPACLELHEWSYPSSAAQRQQSPSQATYRGLRMPMWGMPTSSKGSPSISKP